MLLTRQTRRPPAPQICMAPMIDCVFLLLLYFMCTTSFLKAEKEMATRMPQVGRGAQQDFDPVRILVSKVPQGVLVKCNEQPCASLAVLVARLRALHEIAEVPVVIEGEPGVPFGAMVAALDASYGAGFSQVAFSSRGVDK